LTQHTPLLPKLSESHAPPGASLEPPGLRDGPAARRVHRPIWQSAVSHRQFLGHGLSNALCQCHERSLSFTDSVPLGNLSTCAAQGGSRSSRRGCGKICVSPYNNSQHENGPSVPRTGVRSITIRCGLSVSKLHTTRNPNVCVPVSRRNAAITEGCPSSTNRQFSPRRKAG